LIHSLWAFTLITAGCKMIDRLKFFLFLSLGFLLIAYSPASAQRINVFASFEDEAQVEALEASQGVVLSQSTRYPTWGDKSLEVVYPPEGGVLKLVDIPSDWRRRGALLVFVWSMQPAELTLILRDETGGTFWKTYPVRTGANHIQVKLSRAAGVNLRRMNSIELASRHAGRFYMDYFALDRFHPILEERGRWDVDYTMKVETPHMKWGNPLDGGPIKAYLLAGVADGRGVIELAQRLQLDFKATTLGRRAGTNMYGFGDFYQQRRGPQKGFTLAYTYIADDLLNGPEYDVILWPSIHPWDDFPKEVRENIRKRVEAGAGLILFHPRTNGSEGADLWELSPLVHVEAGGRRTGDKTLWRVTTEHYITRGVPLEAFPWGEIEALSGEVAGELLLETENGTPVLAVKKLGQGRVVAFSYPEAGMIPRIDNIWETGLHYPYQEYLWSMVARAVVWAAGREPATAIRKTELSGNKIKVSLVDLPSPAKLSAWISNEFGEKEGKLEVELKQGQKSTTLEVPKNLSAGRHFFDLKPESEGASLDWATVVVDKEPRVSIVTIEPSSDRVNSGQDIEGKIRLRSAQKSECEVKFRLYDNYDRLIDEKKVQTTVNRDKEISFELSTKGVLTRLAKIDCEVTVGALRQDREIAEVFVLQPVVWDDFDVVMYLFGPNPLPGIWPAIDRQLRRLNVTTLSSYPISLCKHANYNVQAQTRISGQESPDGQRRTYYNNMKKKYVETGDKMVLVREYCLNDPEYRALVKRELEKLVTPWVPFSPLSYYVYEEPSYTCYGDAVDICFSEHCMREMRKWLKEEYGSLEALNSQWGTSFSTWDEVVPDDYRQAQARGNYASWADHRTFEEKTYAECFAFVLKELHKLDPKGILLNSGTQISGSHNGCDYSRINKYTRHLNAYTGGNQLDFHRCFNPEIKISGGAGYGVFGKRVFYNFYRQLFQGCNGGAYIFWQYSSLDPDLTLCGSGRDMVPGFEELRGEGIGKLVGLATPDNHGIAIHYSYPSIHGAWIVDGKVSERVTYNTSRTFNRFNQVRDGWVKLLKDSGLQFDFIAYSAVEQGELISKGYKTFILPMSLALSVEEVEAIRDFVAGGGTIIADALAGVMDEHCTFRKSRLLQDIFGVKLAPATREDIIAMQGEPKLELRGAKALGEQDGRPILLHNRYGKGQAFLLNYFPDSYPEEKREGRNAPALKKIARVLEAAGIMPKVRLRSLTGEPVTSCERYLFNNGTTQLLGLVPDMEMEGPEKVRISIPKRASIYDVRNKRYLGTGFSFETEIEPGVPRLFAFVSNRIGELELEAPLKAHLGDEVEIKFKVRGMEDLRSVAKVQVTDPLGRRVHYYGGNRDIIASKGSLSFRTALNDPRGDWVVEVIEVMSGERQRVVISIN